MDFAKIFLPLEFKQRHDFCEAEVGNIRFARYERRLDNIEGFVIYHDVVSQIYGNHEYVETEDEAVQKIKDAYNTFITYITHPSTRRN